MSSESEHDPEAVKSLRLRLALIEQRRLAEGVPVGTKVHPTPDPGSCKLCRREYGKWCNPLSKSKPGKSPFLEPSRTGALECGSCRNTLNWCWKGWSRKKLVDKLEEPTFHAMYYLTVLLWEDKTMSSEDDCIRGPKDFPAFLMAATVQTEEFSYLQGEMMLGIFWPVDVYRREEGCEPPKNQIETYNFNGKAIRGITRDPKHGTPAGTIKMTNVAGSGTRKINPVVGMNV